MSWQPHGYYDCELAMTPFMQSRSVDEPYMRVGVSKPLMHWPEHERRPAAGGPSSRALTDALNFSCGVR